MHPGFSELARWANFYVIVGSSAGALTGLQFVVITLVAQARAIGSGQEIRAFATPTVVHFCAALIISALMSSPWDDPVVLAVGVGVFGVAGFLYSFRVIYHARQQNGYAPDASDWFWFIALPLVAYAALASAGFFLVWNARVCLWLIATVILLLVIIGIRNAWDTVTYVTLRNQAAFRGSR